MMTKSLILSLICVFFGAIVYAAEQDQPDVVFIIVDSLAKFIPEDPHPGLKVRDWFDQFQK